MKMIDCKQGTHEWHQARLGMPTASRISAVVTPAGKPTANAARRRYVIDLAVERITKRPTETFVSFAMQRGLDMEDLARVWYFTKTRTPANKAGFCVADNGLSGCSPDGLVGDDGMIEIKCPGLANYAEIVATGEIPAEWLMQCHHALYVTGRPWIDFVLFTDIEPFTGWIKRIQSDIVIAGNIHAAVCDFAAEVDAMTQAIIAGAGIRPEQLDFPAPIIDEDGFDPNATTTGE
jgi:hypothetical protein